MSMLENEVRRAAFERLGGDFLAQRAGHKNKRHVRTAPCAIANAEKPSNAQTP